MELRRRVTQALRRSQKKEMRTAVVFPGQGVQKLGMGNTVGSDFIDNVLSDVQAVIGPRLASRLRYLISLDPNGFSGEERIIFEEELNETSMTQLAIFSVSAAASDAYFEKAQTLPSVVWGHSIGEFAAVYASGIMKRKDVIWLVYQRGERMSLCCPKDPVTNEYRFGMMWVIGEIDEKKIESCLKRTRVKIANFNTPKQVVISGEREELKRVSLKLRKEGYKTGFVKRVAGAFHHPDYMAQVRTELETVLSPSNRIRKIEIREPAIPIIFNYSGDFEKDPNRIRTYLKEQVANTVRCRQAFERFIEEGIQKENIIELGGNVLTGMLADFPGFRQSGEESESLK